MKLPSHVMGIGEDGYEYVVRLAEPRCVWRIHEPEEAPLAAVIYVTQDDEELELVEWAGPVPDEPTIRLMGQEAYTAMRLAEHYDESRLEE